MAGQAFRDGKTRSVCYILSYYFPAYVRTKTLLAALGRIDGLRVHAAVNHITGPLRYLETLGKLLWVRLMHNPECYILGFRGYELYWMVRLVTAGRRLFLDHMMSPYDSLLNERMRIRRDGILARLLYWYERAILQSSEVVLTDTVAHAEMFAKVFDVPLETFHTVPVGAAEEPSQDICQAVEPAHSPLRVFFYGSFLPLHGIPIILEAAALLQGSPVHFTLVGGRGRTLAAFRRAQSQLGLDNVTHLKWIEQEDLPRWIEDADLCLGGPFGNTGQARRVVTGKTYQCMALGKPIIVGETDGDHGFRDHVNCILVPQGDPGALADAIAWCRDHRDKLGLIGRRGRDLYLERFSVDAIARRLEAALQA